MIWNIQNQFDLSLFPFKICNFKFKKIWLQKIFILFLNPFYELFMALTDIATASKGPKWFPFLKHVIVLAE